MLRSGSIWLRRAACPMRQAVHRRDRRHLLTVAIETSCDDTSVAVLEAHGSIKGSNTSTKDLSKHASLHFHKKVTAHNAAHTGIHPIIALESHQGHLATLLQDAIQQLPSYQQIPDFISVTRGPGMRSSLSTGLDTAKGLAVSWRIPLLAVNHMQAHALTPRLVWALETPITASLAPSYSQRRMDDLGSGLVDRLQPTFPFVSLLVSGGHTMLLHSKALCDHSILASTSDIAIGEAIDKMARVILPSNLTASLGGVGYGRALEQFAFPDSHQSADYEYTAPLTRGAEIEKRESPWGWSLPIPLAGSRSGRRQRPMEFSFSGLESSVRRVCSDPSIEMGVEERRYLARDCMRVSFEHLATRLVWALEDLEPDSSTGKINTLVLSGGVASNAFLKHILQSYLKQKGLGAVNIVCPPVDLCTDNAAMIAWAGMEMWHAGWRSDLSVRALRKWSLDPQQDDGGILGPSGWMKRTPD